MFMDVRVFIDFLRIKRKENQKLTSTFSFKFGFKIECTK